MTDTPKPIVAATTPPTHDHDYHPDHPGNVATLIHALHIRLMALEVELGLRAATPAAAPVVAPPPVAPSVPVEEPVAPAVTTPPPSGTL